MKKKNNDLVSVRSICFAGVIAALYTVLSVSQAGFAYDAIQCRIAEAMTIMPVLFPAAIPGLTIGCLISNIILTGEVLDVIFGTLATLIAAIGTWFFRHIEITKWRIPWVSALCPVVSNGIIVGTVVHILYAPSISLPMNMLFVAIGEVGAMVMGIFLLMAMRRINIERLI